MLIMMRDMCGTDLFRPFKGLMILNISLHRACCPMLSDVGHSGLAPVGNLTK
jgi:hypothetical protein